MRHLVTSDIHLGNHFSRGRQFTTMVQRLNSSITLVLAGDIVDAPGGLLSKDDVVALDAIRNRASNEQVIWIEGNHDKGYRLEEPGNIQFVDSYALDKRLYIVHGDQFVGIKMFRNALFLKTFKLFHNLRILFGADPVHVADYAKKFRVLYDFLRRKIMNCAVEYGHEKNFKAVACGHVHFAEDTIHEGIRYINLGAWTEATNHCLLVNEEKMELITIENAMQDSEWFTTELSYNEAEMVK